MHFIKIGIPDVVIIEPHDFGDERGFPMETRQRKTFAGNEVDFGFVQENQGLELLPSIICNDPALNIDWPAGESVCFGKDLLGARVAETEFSQVGSVFRRPLAEAEQ